MVQPMLRSTVMNVMVKHMKVYIKIGNQVKVHLVAHSMGGQTVRQRRIIA